MWTLKCLGMNNCILIYKYNNNVTDAKINLTIRLLLGNFKLYMHL